MLEKLRRRSGEETGFTLVELLVVMLILGILAAIAIPSFFNQRDKARDADSKADVRTAQTALETFATENGGDYQGATAGRLQAIETTLSDANISTLTVLGPQFTGYTVGVTNPDTGNEFLIQRDPVTGATTFDCTVEEDAGCPLGGDWGN